MTTATPSALERLGSLGATVRCRPEQEIYGEGDPAECGFRVLDGAARRYAIHEDGRRRIVDFLLPGDFFGFAARDSRSFTVQAVHASTVLARYEWRGLDRLSQSDPQIGRAIRAATGQEISRLQARVLLLGRINAVAKVSGFLLEMANRCAKAGPERIFLPMSRYDMADYLALSVETVSRAFTVLKRRGAIAVAGTRQIRICDPAALSETASCENGGRCRWLFEPAPTNGAFPARSRNH